MACQAWHAAPEGELRKAKLLFSLLGVAAACGASLVCSLLRTGPWSWRLMPMARAHSRAWGRDSSSRRWAGSQPQGFGYGPTLAHSFACFLREVYLGCVLDLDDFGRCDPGEGCICWGLAFWSSLRCGFCSARQTGVCWARGSTGAITRIVPQTLPLRAPQTQGKLWLQPHAKQ